MTATPAGMTYADYLKLDQLLTAQQPLSDLHDEMLFIVIHQTKELWMKELLHELRYAIDLVQEDRFAEAYKAMSRIGRIQAVMTLSWDVLSTLTPVDYLKFRDVLGTSSGFQSEQFREIEFRLGLKDPNSSTITMRAAASARRSSGLWKSRACARPRSARSNALGSTLATAPKKRSLRRGSRSTATPSAGSTCTSSPKSWSISTTHWRAGGTSMCSPSSGSSATGRARAVRRARPISAPHSRSGCFRNCGR